MREIADGVYVETAYHGANVSFVYTDEGAVLIDTPMQPREAWDWLGEVASRSNSRLAYLINTDYHIDHVLGNCFYRAITIAHELTWRELRNYDEAYLQRQLGYFRERYVGWETDLHKIRIVLPEVTVGESLTVYKGGREFQIVHVGGHTPATIAVYMPQERVLFSGDLVVSGQHPFLGHANTEQWLAALERIRNTMPVDIIVPGHGEPCGPEAIEEMHAYIAAMRERVYEHFQAGATRRETVDHVKMRDFYHIPEGERKAVELRIRSSVERVYDEYKKAAEKKKRAKL
ncbi:MAG: MBL fold metallo-hydrolase [Chloroflexi bacterium]|nr:MBL fold metallo-hydrolase [Chloroflexota bacterium]